MKIWLFPILVIAVVCVGCGTDDSAQKAQDRSDKIAAFEDGIADHLSSEVGTISRAGKDRINNTVSSCSMSVVDEAENKAKVTATFSGGSVIYARGEVERDEDGKWHPDDSSFTTAE